MEIQKEIPPLQILGLQGEEVMREISRYIEAELGRMQGEIFTLRQFLEPAVKNNENTPDQEFNPLE